MSGRYANRPQSGFKPVVNLKRHAAKVKLHKAKESRYGVGSSRAPDCKAARCSGGCYG